MIKKGRVATKFIPYNGLWGQYELPNHLKVEYVLASIDLEKDQEKLKDIQAVREVLDVNTLPFEHLLQRDLDDARIADEIVNEYLAEPEPVSPVFFPPITVVILPKEDGKVSRFYPTMTPTSSRNEFGEYEECAAGDTFSVKIYTDKGRRTQDCELSVNPSSLDGDALRVNARGRLVLVVQGLLSFK